MNSEQVQEIFIEDIIPNRFQPRLTFDEKALQELSDSIKVHGVIQPLVLRKVGNKYEIIAGERRYKASCMAGLKKVPAIVRELTDNESAEIALIENIQRKNLSSIEEAQSYKNLLERGYLTQEALAQKLGVAQSTIANKLRLLNLCDEVQNALLNEQISERHARSLLQITNPDDQKKMLNRITKERLTVKQLDNEIKKMLHGDSSETSETGGAIMEPTNEQSTNNQDFNKNIFGFSIEPPTDLETSAPNLNVGFEDSVPPISFNPFAESPSVNSNMSTPDPITESPVGGSIPAETVTTSEPLETFDMFGDIIKPEVEQQSAPNFSFDQGFSPLGVGPQEADKAEASTSGVKNIGDQINNIRNATHVAEEAGFRVEMEEYDFEDMYQMVIKIKK